MNNSSEINDAVIGATLCSLGLSKKSKVENLYSIAVVPDRKNAFATDSSILCINITEISVSGTYLYHILYVRVNEFNRSMGGSIVNHYSARVVFKDGLFGEKRVVFDKNSDIVKAINGVIGL